MKTRRQQVARPSNSHDPQTAARTSLPRHLPAHVAKIVDRHRALLAYVYIRQSSPHQVLEHRESRERQYELVDLAAGLGWPRERIVVVDEDQGQSGATAHDRVGFQRLINDAFRHGHRGHDVPDQLPVVV